LTYDHKKTINKLIINQDMLLRTPINQERRHIYDIQDAVRFYRDIYEEKKNNSDKAQHVPHQENISYLNPRK
jgi:hypothetical protein